MPDGQNAWTAHVPEGAGVNNPGAFFFVRANCLRMVKVLIRLCALAHVPGREPFNYNTGHFGAACAALQHAGPAGIFRNCQENPS
jgi:hypothetical protein